MHLFMSDLHKDKTQCISSKKTLQEQETIKSRNKLKPEGPVKPALSAIHAEWHLQNRSKGVLTLTNAFFI